MPSRRVFVSAISAAQNIAHSAVQAGHSVLFTTAACTVSFMTSDHVRDLPDLDVLFGPGTGSGSGSRCAARTAPPLRPVGLAAICRGTQNVALSRQGRLENLRASSGSVGIVSEQPKLEAEEKGQEITGKAREELGRVEGS